jgi:hypothetical protein
MSELVKSKQRVADHGEVFTPSSIVEAMLDLVRSESERIESRFLEPACGSGNFLVPVLRRKLATGDARYGRSDFERRHHALVALMSVYGIELLPDNVAECRANLLEVLTDHLALPATDIWARAAANVLAVNIVHGDALSMETRTSPVGPIAFAEWTYLGKGRFHRRDFRFDTITQMSSFGEEDTLFADLGKHEIFTPTLDHGALAVLHERSGRLQPPQPQPRRSVVHRQPVERRGLHSARLREPDARSHRARVGCRERRGQHLGEQGHHLPRSVHQVWRVPT